MKDKLFFVASFNLNTKTGTPTRSRTTIEAAKKFADVRVLATAPYDADTIDFSKSLDFAGKSKIRKIPLVFGLTNFFREPIVFAMLFMGLVRERPKKIYCFHTPAGAAGGLY